MRYTLESDVLTLYFEGELNSFNAENIGADIEETVKKLHFCKVLLNFANLSYISSAGLRIVLRIKQKYSNVEIIEASLEVYDILDMTGFINIMPIKKAIKKIYIDGAQIIGEGFFSTVYRINKDTIIKVFNRVSDPQQIERELKLAKEAFVLGIPTAISFDIVKVGDKLGVRFEMLDCQSLKNAFLNEPNNYINYIEKYAKLLKKINTTDCMDPTLPNAKDAYLYKVELIKEYIDEKHYLKAKRIVESIPERMTFVHGDCHFKNIMVQGDEFLLIDMDTLSRGHPIFELAAIRAPYIAFEEDDPGNCEKFLGVSKELASNIYNDVVNEYLGKDDLEIKDKIAIICYIHMIWWNRVNEPENTKRLEGCKARLFDLLDKYDDVEIGL